jgi:hypothetical protein
MTRFVEGLIPLISASNGSAVEAAPTKEKGLADLLDRRGLNHLP